MNGAMDGPMDDPLVPAMDEPLTEATDKPFAAASKDEPLMVGAKDGENVGSGQSESYAGTLSLNFGIIAKASMSRALHMAPRNFAMFFDVFAWRYE
mmetsp:Transcript_5550/g.11007  ORF Transcript_5550/g.11007 Transcript_5550/m.11007 type:complete len:96 (-) Transcript_5550:105-392(-)|eukprot:CAMPEP_0170195834 /NCGR_PEP_ID=MMETSP0040_2-20121228/62357_1 /TAXON_ID=641309 /ORGANISM="Lotharella oceanica, Strain CCMP622" /LENGTH=95 /DNA_ID=CAMNT_0010445105 /DNA_START=349 /DNA_END=636 /DNA_ORIENTATION=+